MTYLEAGDVYRSIESATWKTGTFTVTDQHLALLRKANVRWEDVEFGAPAIDGKRPYGNGSVTRDIAEILNEPGWQAAVAEDDRHDDDRAVESWLEENNDRLVRLHAETGIALQIALATGAFATGNYRLAKSYDGTTWEAVTAT
jgi:hypothetical protein